MIEILICDDELQSLIRTRDFLLVTSYHAKTKTEIITYDNPDELIRHVRKAENQTAILLLEVDMPGMSGLEIARLIRDENLNVILIFLTAHEEFVYTSFEYAPFRYIRKDYMREELVSAINAAIARVMATSGRTICFKMPDGEVLLNVADITHFQIENRRVCIYTAQGEHYPVWKKLKEIREEIQEKDDAFVQVHSGCVINLRHVKTLQSGTVVLDDAKEIKVPISRRRQQEVSSIISSYWRDNL